MFTNVSGKDTVLPCKKLPAWPTKDICSSLHGGCPSYHWYLSVAVDSGLAQLVPQMLYFMSTNIYHNLTFYLAVTAWASSLTLHPRFLSQHESVSEFCFILWGPQFLALFLLKSQQVLVHM